MNKNTTSDAVGQSATNVTDCSLLIFDYGGTLDTESVHWSWVLWDAYQAEQMSVSLQHFREAYVYAERTLAREPLVSPEDNMLDLLRKKVDIETRYLMEHRMLDTNEVSRRAQTEHIALRCYNHARAVVGRSREVLELLAQNHRLALVTNFYGNIHAILTDFNIDHLFPVVIESAVAGVRKPNPEIFRLAIEASAVTADQTCVIGDSYSNDIEPASLLGCKTIWIPGREWEDKTVGINVATHVAEHLSDLIGYFCSPRL
mgnify:CR=1 FL=1